MNKFIFSILLAVGSLMSMQLWADEPIDSLKEDKFYVGMTFFRPGTNNQTRVMVNDTVYGDFHFVIEMPKKGQDSIALDTASIYAYMKHVKGLQVDSIRQDTKTFKTGVGEGRDKNKKLSDYMSNVYNFTGTTLPITVEDITDTARFTYNVTGIGADGKIVATPNSVAKAKDAWSMITKRAISLRAESDDNYVFLKKGFFIKIGNQKIIFKKDVKILPGPGTLAQLDSVLNDTSVVKYQDYSDAEAEYVMQYIFVPAGCIISIGASYASLKEPMLLTVDGSLYNGIPDLYGWIKDMVFQFHSGKYQTMTKILERINDVFGLIDKTSVDSVPITLDFSGIGKAYYDPHIQPVRVMGDYWKLQNDHKNVVMMTNVAYKDNMEGESNVIIKDDYIFTCDSLILWDKGVVKTERDFYTPTDFTAVRGHYIRSLTSNYNSCCVPFKIHSSMVVDASGNPVSGAKIYTYLSCDGKNANFQEVTDSLPASTPCLIYSPEIAELRAYFDSTRIVYNIDNTGYFRSTYYHAKTDTLGTGSNYMLVDGGTCFGNATAVVYPFRAILSVPASAGVASRLNINILRPGIQTGLNENEYENENMKFIQNGRLFIRHNGQVFNAAGQVVK